MASHRSLSFISRRAIRADHIGVDADGPIVLAEDDAGDVLGRILRAGVSVEGDVRGALQEVGVLVEAHCGRLVGLGDTAI